MLARIRKAMEEREEGFTLIELLVVIIIIGILAAIAIPVFLNQRKKGYDASIKSDLRTSANEMETYFTDNQAYTTTVGATGINAPSVSKNNKIEGYVNGNGFCLRGSNPNSDAVTTYYWYDSQKGGLQSGSPTASVSGGVACSVASPTWATLAQG